MSRRLSRVFVVLGLVVLVAACSGAPRRRRRRPRPRPRRPRRRRIAIGAPPAASLTIYGAASLKGALDKAKAAYETANPGTTLDDLDRLVGGARDADRAGRAGRRLPVGRHDEPEEARRQGPRRRRPGDVRRQQADRHRPGGQPGRDQDAGRPGQDRGSRSSPPATRCRSRSTRRSSSRTWPRRPATRPTSPRPTPPTSRRRRTTSRRWSPRSSSARATPGSSTSPTPRPRRKVATVDVPDSANVPATYDGVVVKASTNAAAAKAFLDWLAGPGRPGDPGQLRLPPAAVTAEVPGR